jgi:hypothetical protein
MNEKLNQQYFAAKKTHKRGYRKRKLTFKRVLINLILTFVLIFIYSLLQESCERKIEENRTSYTIKKSTEALKG